MRKAVYSSFIDTLDWDVEKGILTVEYQRGGASQHAMTEDQAMAVWNAPSIGEALHAMVPGFGRKKRANAG